MAHALIPFQFDNLVKGRIPFAFFNLDVDISTAYAHVYKYHLESLRLSIPEDLSADPLFEFLKKQKFPSDFAMVVVCQTGQRSRDLALLLESGGYKNVFYIEGGWVRLLDEQKSGF